MAITREVINVQSTYNEDITMSRPEFSKWELVDTVESPGKKEATYQYLTGDPEYPATIRIGIYENESNNSKTTSVSAKLSTYLKKTDDDGVITYHPWSVVVACNGPHAQTLTGSGVKAAISNVLLFSGLIKPLATPLLQGTPVTTDATVFNRLKFGVPTFDPSDMDDPATV